MMTTTTADRGWRLDLRGTEPAWEFVAFDGAAGAPPAPFPAAPGAMTLDAAGRPALLHFAPGRWLALAPAPEAGALGACGVAVDVTGKWQGLVLNGPRAARLLASTADLASTLLGRDCAALELFDCPAILAALPGNGGLAPSYAIWVQSSFLDPFLDAAQRAPLPDPQRDL